MNERARQDFASSWAMILDRGVSQMEAKAASGIGTAETLYFV
jgi:hypothetical protein